MTTLPITAVGALIDVVQEGRHPFETVTRQKGMLSAKRFVRAHVHSLRLPQITSRWQSSSPVQPPPHLFNSPRISLNTTLALRGVRQFVAIAAGKDVPTEEDCDPA